MFPFDYHEAFDRLLDYYYGECPHSIMPLLLLYLQQDSNAEGYIEERIRKPLEWKDDPESKYISPVLSQFTRSDALELSLTDPAGKSMLERWTCNGMDHMAIVIACPDARVQEIRVEFQKMDDALRENMKSRKALFSFVQGLESIPRDILAGNYLDFASRILKRAEVLDEMEDYDLSMFEKMAFSLDRANIKGNVFIAQAQAPFLAATFTNANIITETAGADAELDAMVCYLLLKGNGCRNVTCTHVDRPFIAGDGDKYDFVIMNRARHDAETRLSDWHECLKNVRDNMSDTCRFIGLIENRQLFAMLGKQPLFRECVDNKELEMIILLPKKYGCSIVALNMAKKNKDSVSLVNLYNEDISFDAGYSLQRSRYRNIIRKNSVRVTVDVLRKAQYKIQKFFEYKLPELDGFELVPLRKYLLRLTASSSFGVRNGIQEECVSVIEIDEPYDPFRYMVSTKEVNTFSIYDSYYCLDDDTLIVSRQGALDAVLYPGSRGTAYVKDVLAFAIRGEIFPPYIVNELRKSYVKTQLEHWSCSPEGYHSEDDILDLKIYVPISDDVYKTEEDIVEKELDRRILPNGYPVYDKESGDCYRIRKCLGPGGFGITYLAEVDNDREVEEPVVVLKEYFATGFRGQESVRDDHYRVSLTLGDLNEVTGEANTFVYLVKFIEEAQVMRYFRKFRGSRIRSASEVFMNSVTNTCYYVMDYYPKGTLEDELHERDCMAESEAIERIMIPLARALKTMHDNGWLHLDVKASNILIDEDGYGVLGDLGISQHWDENGNKLTKGMAGIGSEGASAKQKDHHDEQYASEFHPEQDIYSMAALYYRLLTGFRDHEDFSLFCLDMCDVSQESKNAIAVALSDGDTLESTPKTVLEFMRMLPGCQDLELPEIFPAEGVPEHDDDFDFDMDDLDLPGFDIDDLPYAE